MTDQELEQEFRRRLRDAPDIDRVQRGLIATVLKLAKEEGALNPETRADPGTNTRQHPTFVTIPPNNLPGSPHHRVPTTQPPGGIRVGHVLQYFHDMLETLQPDDTPIPGRVHPLTVRISPQHPVTNIIRSRDDLLWAVVHRDDESLVLTPVPVHQVKELAARRPQQDTR